MERSLFCPDCAHTWAPRSTSNLCPKCSGYGTIAHLNPARKHPPALVIETAISRLGKRLEKHPGDAVTRARVNYLARRLKSLKSQATKAENAARAADPVKPPKPRASRAKKAPEAATC